jgi:hypothetical protein
VRVVMHFAPTTLLKSVYGFHQLNDTVHAEQMMGVSWRASTNQCRRFRPGVVV